jgi:hypothetical protein
MGLILPDDEEVCLAELKLHRQPRIDRPEIGFPNPTQYTILTPEGVRVQCEFLMWALVSVGTEISSNGVKTPHESGPQPILKDALPPCLLTAVKLTHSR